MPAFSEYPLPFNVYPSYQFTPDPINLKKTKTYVLMGIYLQTINLTYHRTHIKGHTNYYICIKFESSRLKNGIRNAKAAQITN